MPGPKLISAKIEDGSDLAFANKVSTLKIRVRNESDHAVDRVYLSPPPGFWEKGEVKGRYGEVQLMWGGGVLNGCLVALPGDKTVLASKGEGLAYFLVFPSSRCPEEVDIPLDVYVGEEGVERLEFKLRVEHGGLKAHIYRPRFVPRIDESILPLVKKVIERYGMPDVETRTWPIDMSAGTIKPKVEIYFEGVKIAVITGDIGSGFMHISKIKVLRDVYVGEAPTPKGGRKWYWVARVWFFWLDKSVFDEVPDAERVELWINPDTEEVDWLVTDAHWREVAYRGPVECAEVRIIGGVHRTLRSKLVGLVKSYHPPKVENMELYMTSADSRDPNSEALTFQYLKKRG